MNCSNSEVQEVGTGKRDFTQYHLTFAQCCLLNVVCSILHAGVRDLLTQSQLKARDILDLI